MDADALYALAPEDFTVARDAAARQARADGDRAAATALKALRRPSVSAWLVNRLAADHRELLEELLALGPALAEAQAARHAAGLRELGRQRRALVEAVADTALERRASSAAVREEVAATLEAALADPASADAVRSGRLVRALGYAGLGGVDLAGAVADVRAGADQEDTAHREAAPDERWQQAVATAEQAGLTAAGRLDDAVQAARRAEQAATQAADRVAAADRVLSAAATALAAAQDDRAQAARAAADAGTAQGKARDAVRSAQDTAEQTRAALDALRRSPRVSGG